jgi:8-oxo-dGTP pyrophosphatase MutT (NUDIX family)
MTFREALAEELKCPLPGREYQMKMAPEGRMPGMTYGDTKKDAAVALILFENLVSKKNELVLIRRADYKGHHSGQVSFPGGKLDMSDSDLFITAIRESQEEIGIQLHMNDFMGKLTPLYIQVSGFLVQPYVFYLQEIPRLKADKEEVSYLIRCSIDSLLDDSLIKKMTIESAGNAKIAPYYAINGEVVWGATSMILAEFIEILRRIKIKNSGFF